MYSTVYDDDPTRAVITVGADFYRLFEDIAALSAVGCLLVLPHS
jgi:hypothetical protein